LNRLELINDTSQKIMDGDLARRVPSRGSGDEFDQLADHLNRMLDQTESLMEDIRRVSDNIAHDLKTPLSRLRQRLEALSRRYAEDSTHRADLEAALLEADHLLDTFNALLKIARIESGPRQANLKPVNLIQLAADVVELYEPLAEEKRQQLIFHRHHASNVIADRDMLFQAFANLLDNAIKYTPVGGIISVHCSSNDVSAELAVTDSGPGIPAGQREKVFQRFYRMDKSRSTTGSGLGLSLVQAVARLHGATVTLTDQAPGLTVRFVLPRFEHEPL
jgi:signal transduction histidine kinase